MAAHRSTLLIPLGTKNLECLAALVWKGRALRETVPPGTLGSPRACRGKQ